MKPEKYFTKDKIQEAMRHTKSVRAAAKYLGCSYVHLKRYMKMYTGEEGKTLFDIHKNPHGEGIPKFLPNRRKEPIVKIIFETGTGWESFSPEKIKIRGIAEGFLMDRCYRCDFCERRVTDYKAPLLLNFKDGNKMNYLLGNLELLCYNCMFLYGGLLQQGEEVLTESEIRHIENNTDTQANPYTWELDDAAIENMKALGLI